MENIIIRNAILAICCFAQLVKDRVSIFSIPKNLLPLLLLRGLFGILSTIGLYLAFDFLPLSLATTLYYSHPIFVAIMCYFFLAEKLKKLEIISVISAMFGVIMLTYP